jgi:transposase
MAAEVDQGFLFPPDMRDWLDPEHLVFTVLDAVAQFDLSGFRAGYRADGRGGAAYDPQLMVGLLLFAYCEGVRSSRQIERRCARDVAYRILSGNRQPDHATIARFRDRHRAALAGVFVQVLRLCAEAGLVRVGLVALDGTKLEANASSQQNYDLDRLDRAIGRVSAQIEQLLAEAAGQDAEEDAAEVDRHDPPVPPQLQNREQRLTKLKEAKARLQADAARRQAAQDQRRADREEASKQGRARGQKPAVKVPDRARGNGKTNLTDPDSKIMKTRFGLRQAFNAQAVATRDQIMIEARIVPDNTDYTSFHPMLDAARDALDAAGVKDLIRAVVADAGYSSQTNRAQSRPDENDPIPLVKVPPLGGKRSTKPAEPTTTQPAADSATEPQPATEPALAPLGRYEPPVNDNDPRFVKDPTLHRMARRLANPAGQRLYARRKTMIEPVFGQIKTLNGARLHHRGYDKVNTEWKMMAAAHNLLKYWRAGLAVAI